MTQHLFWHRNWWFLLGLSGYLTVELGLLLIHVVLLHLIEERCLLLLLGHHHLLLLLGHWLAWSALRHHHAHVGVVGCTLAGVLPLHELHGHGLVVLMVLSHHLLLLLDRHVLEHAWCHHHLVLRSCHSWLHATHHHLVKLLGSLKLAIVHLTKVRS